MVDSLIKDAILLVNYKPSTHSKEILEYVEDKVTQIRKKIKLKIVIVYREQYPKLKSNNITKLPTLIFNGNKYSGNNSVMQQIESVINSVLKNNSKRSTNTPKVPMTSKNVKKDYTPPTDDVNDYLLNQIQEGLNDDNGISSGRNPDSDDEEFMEKVKKRAVERTIINNKTKNSTNRRTNNRISSTPQKTTGVIIDPNDIAAMEDDPEMKKFWENQTETPM